MNATKQYHKAFSDIEKEPIKLVRQTIKDGLFKKEKTIEQKQNLIKDLHKNLSNFYNVEPINIEFNKEYADLVGIYGQFNARNKTITLKNTSIVSYLHEFKHYLQHATQKENNEDIAISWSISLYYLATPKLCRNAIEKGLIAHQNVFIE